MLMFAVGWVAAGVAAGTAAPSCDAVVQNQGRCGSCYSFAMTAMLAARLASNSTLCEWGGVLSPEVPVAFWALGGCDGAQPEALGRVAMTKGLPTLSCAEYVSGSCEEKSEEAAIGCTLGKGYVEGTCYSNASLPWHTWGTYDQGHITDVTAFAGAQAYMEELTTNGPFVAVFAVYENFYSYDSGVYRTASGNITGTHAVLVTGYGTDTDGTDYWVVRNSWGASWGDGGALGDRWGANWGGYFRMLRGANLAQFEAYGVAYALGTSALLAHAPVVEHPMAGNWVPQDPAAAVVVGARSVLEELNGQTYLLASHTQVVNGLNVQLHVHMESVGREVKATLHRPVASKTELLSAQPPQWQIVSIVDVQTEVLV